MMTRKNRSTFRPTIDALEQRLVLSGSTWKETLVLAIESFHPHRPSHHHAKTPHASPRARGVHTKGTLIANIGGPYSAGEASPIKFSATSTNGVGVVTYAWDFDNNGTYE